MVLFTHDEITKCEHWFVAMNPFWISGRISFRVNKVWRDNLKHLYEASSWSLWHITGKYTLNDEPNFSLCKFFHKNRNVCKSYVCRWNLFVATQLLPWTTAALKCVKVNFIGWFRGSDTLTVFWLERGPEFNKKQRINLTVSRIW